MQGSVIKYEGKRGLTWTFVIDVGRDAGGKRIQKWRRGFPTKKAAETAMQLELHQRRSGTYIEKTPRPSANARPLARDRGSAQGLSIHAGGLPSDHPQALETGSRFCTVQNLTPAAVQKFYSGASTPASDRARCNSAIYGSRKRWPSRSEKGSSAECLRRHRQARPAKPGTSGPRAKRGASSTQLRPTPTRRSGSWRSKRASDGANCSACAGKTLTSTRAH